MCTDGERKKEWVSGTRVKGIELDSPTRVFTWSDKLKLGVTKGGRCTGGGRIERGRLGKGGKKDGVFLGSDGPSENLYHAPQGNFAGKRGGRSCEPAWGKDREKTNTDRSSKVNLEAGRM